MKNHIDFYNDLDTTFFWFWDDFGSKNLSQMTKSVILNNPPMVVLYFSTLEALIFDQKGYIFHMFFQMLF